MILAYTLCSLHHLAGALVLGRSLREQHPEWKFVIGLCDRAAGRVMLDDLEFPVVELEEVEGVGAAGLVGRYNPLELNCAAKSYLAAHLLRTRPDATALVYLDADMRVFAPLNPVLESLSSASLLLTPHRLCPPMDAAVIPDETYFNRSGVYNAGFFAVRRCDAADRFLAWWQTHVARHCFVIPEAGLSVDQVWLNHAPVYFPDVRMLTDPGCNVAYWNLDERELRHADSRWTVRGGGPLRFFHFSGFHWQRPERLSMHRHAAPDPAGALPGLLRDYAAALRAQGAERFAGLPCLLEEERAAAETRRNSSLPFHRRVSRFAKRFARRVGRSLIYRFPDDRLEP